MTCKLTPYTHATQNTSAHTHAHTRTHTHARTHARTPTHAHHTALTAAAVLRVKPGSLDAATRAPLSHAYTNTHTHAHTRTHARTRTHTHTHTTLTAAAVLRINPGSLDAAARARVRIQGPAVVAHLPATICKVFRTCRCRVPRYPDTHLASGSPPDSRQGAPRQQPLLCLHSTQPRPWTHHRALPWGCRTLGRPTLS